MYQQRPQHVPIVDPAHGRNRYPLHPADNLPLRGTMPAPPAAKADAQKPGSPPLPRQSVKTIPPSPPQVIRDHARQLEFLRIGLLGEGGFARVYEVKNSRNQRIACKVVVKDSLKTKKAKTKLYAEIKIHKSLNHPNIVNFQDCFEDDANVYMTLELCHNGSLMDMLRRRRRFTEPEARFFMVQLLGACHYMHTHQVIHRDLKLGNIFLDSNMNVKVGDFGLAALIESPGERKKTICGTPNYIAPEVLFDTANGHSFEVDTWSIGVILYTLVVGKPPFQTKDVKAIYKRIRDNEYDFPTDREVSNKVQLLIQAILTPDPQARPSLHEILDDRFFTSGIVPSYIPASAHDMAPDFSHISMSTSRDNLRELRRDAMLDDDQVTAIAIPAAPPAPERQPKASSSAASSLPSGKLKTATSSLAQQEKEFHHAVQPGSPISALLKSARQPLVVGPSPAGKGAKEEPLLRKLQAAQRERPATEPVSGERMHNIVEDEEDLGKGQRERGVEKARVKELESQKARIVAQMAPPGPALDEGAHLFGMPLDQEKFAPTRKDGKAKQPVVDSAPMDDGPLLKVNSFDDVAVTLSAAFDARSTGQVYRDPRDSSELPDEKVFIVSWVDYCNKYGMGYALTDGSVGVHFNDSTTLVLAPDKHSFDFVTSRHHGSAYVRKNHTIDDHPEEAKGKVYLLKHFERYIMDRLYGEYDYTFEDIQRTKGMVFVQKYLRMKHVIVFKMSHDALQFNFYDHSKVIISSHGLRVTHIDKNYQLTRWKLTEIMAASLRAPSSDPETAKFQQRLLDKVKYCRDVLLSIKNASDNPPPAVEKAVPVTKEASRSSRNALR